MIKKLNIGKNLHVLIVEDKDEKVFIAHCLDMDLVAQGKTEKEAVSDLCECIRVQLEYCLENDMLDTAFRRAAPEYWDMFYRSQAANTINQISIDRKNIKDLISHLEFAHA